MSSGFISEAEITEQRKLRQEEWERVRSADQPLEVPEETYDPRSLYERLQEQKNKRDIEYEEAHKLKNMIKGLDDDEVEFLDLVDRTKLEEERKKNLEEAKEMRDFKAAVASLQEKSLDERLKHELRKPVSSSSGSGGGSGSGGAHKGLISSSKNSQLKLLAGVLVKKNESKGRKRKLSESREEENQDPEAPKSSDAEAKVPKGSDSNPEDAKSLDAEAKVPKSSDPDSELPKEEKEEDEPEVTESSGSLKCIGILPGLGSYEDSSDSICSSDSDHSEHNSPYKFDLLGRKIEDPKDKEKS